MGSETDRLQEQVSSLRAQIEQREAEMADKERQLERYAHDLQHTFRRESERTHELRDSYMATVRALSNAVEARDAYTGKHAERVAAYALAIARVTGSGLAGDPQMEFGFLLHDVGKVAIPDAILFKPNPLSEDERRLMERHPTIGWEILREVDFLGAAKDVVRFHHERWDGQGYPDGLSGTDIPYAARVFAVADTLDALTTTRPYRQALGFGRAREIIAAEAGTQFDPAIVAAFLELDDVALEQIEASNS